MQQAYAGGATSEGHRIVEVSKTVTQQPRPELERQISAGYRASAQPSGHTGAAVTTGLGAVAAGTIASRTGKRKLSRFNSAVDQAREKVRAATDEHQDASANAHGAHLEQTDHTNRLQGVKARQAELKAWEGSDHSSPHVETINGKVVSVTKPRSPNHVRVTNAYARQANEADAGAKAASKLHGIQQQRALDADRTRTAATELQQRGEMHLARIKPQVKRRIRNGRLLAAGGGTLAAGALVHGELKRGRVDKGLGALAAPFKFEGADAMASAAAKLPTPAPAPAAGATAAAKKPGVLKPTATAKPAATAPAAKPAGGSTPLSKMIGYGDFRGAAGATRAALGRAGKNPEFTARVTAARAGKLVPTKAKPVRTPYVRPQTGELSARIKQAGGRP